MNKIQSVFVTSFLIATTCYTQELQNENLILEKNRDSVKIGWPKDVESLIKHLNNWYVDELDAYERPHAYPNFKTSRETNGWVSEHKRLLTELGVSVIWNKEKMKYQILRDY